jgi:RNA-binding protein
LKVKGVRISTIVHATEDFGKIVVALGRVSDQEIMATKVEKTRLKGHYGNEIMTVTFSLRGGFAESFFRRLWSLLPRNDQLRLIDDVETRVDSDGRLHLRLDKQAAFLGRVQLTEKDPIKLEVSFKMDPASTRHQLELLRQMLEAEDHLGRSWNDAPTC